VRPEYQAFLDRRAVVAAPRGIESPNDPPAHLFQYQAECAQFGLRQGSWACWLGTGLGKTRIELWWSDVASREANAPALILTPLAVARQIEAEGRKLGYDVRVIRSQDDVRPGINVCNYDRLDHLDPQVFGSVALDESSILKDFTGKTSRAIIDAFSGHRWRMSATATPAPNDHVEIAQHSDFCGVMDRAEMLVRWFLNDTSDTGEWRLKGHAIRPFWDWVATWARAAQHPRELGDDVAGFDLPPFRVVRHQVESEVTMEGTLFGPVEVSAADMHRVKRQTAGARAAEVAALSLSNTEPWVIWCDTNYEADAIMGALGDASGVAEVRGSDSPDQKEAALAAFADGSVRVLVSKPSICGWGLNWQHCARMAFAGRTFSFEVFHQAVRRCWRFGQAREVEVHIVTAPGEDHIGRVLDRKADAHDSMKDEMVAAMKRAIGKAQAVKVPYRPTHEGRMPAWL